MALRAIIIAEKNAIIFLECNSRKIIARLMTLTVCSLVVALSLSQLGCMTYHSRPNLMLYLSLVSSELVMYVKLLNLLFIIQCRYISLTIKGALL